MSDPQRTCVGCRQRCSVGDLLRIVAPEGCVEYDLHRRKSGRGAWIHPNPHCLKLARTRGAFARAFRRAVDDSALADVREQC
ncbi:YlxR family protein [Devriesea agamarum]|uniref:YlxR family protein n=1 Tax=Devriesea agamarum TaxID=472569 RepID=UPI0018D36C2C|nr:YlxR family protein [Devriesea agamarum]